MYKHHILIVDDHIELHGFIEKILEGEPFRISSAYNGKEAVTKCKENNYDIVLMDHKMPIMNGFEASIKIRELDASLPIILISAYAKDLKDDYLILSLVDDIMEKPISKRDLLSVLNKNLKNKMHKSLDFHNT